MRIAYQRLEDEAPLPKGAGFFVGNHFLRPATVLTCAILSGNRESSEQGWDMTITQTKIWTYEDYLALPEDDGNRYEVIEGELLVTPAPGSDHQYAVVELIGEIRAFVKARGLGRVYTAPYEVHLDADTRPVQPDVFFVTEARRPKRGTKRMDGAPELVIEVISRSSDRADNSVKMLAYERSGVLEYWIVDPRKQSVRIYTLDDGKFTSWGIYSEDDVITSKVLTGFELRASAIFDTE